MDYLHQEYSEGLDILDDSDRRGVRVFTLIIAAVAIYVGLMFSKIGSLQSVINEAVEVEAYEGD